MLATSCGSVAVYDTTIILECGYTFNQLVSLTALIVRIMVGIRRYVM